MERGVESATKKVKKGLPLARKKVRFEEGISKVTPRSLKEVTTCFSLEVFVEEVMVRSALKTWDIAEGVMEREGYERESDESDDLMR